MRTRRLVCTLLLGFGACAESSSNSIADTGGREWSLSSEPTLRIGVVEGEQDYLMHLAASSATLPDGGVAVLNAGSSQLRIYDAAGRIVSRAGRQGTGPGEFRKPLRLYVVGDTIVVFDAGAARLSHHDLNGQFLRTEPLEGERGQLLWDEWLYDRSWVDGPKMGRGRATVVPALAKLPAPDSTEGFRYVRVSDFGHLWVRSGRASGAATGEWRIYDLTGTQVGRLELPQGFEIHEIGPDYVLGRSWDSDGIEYVDRYSLETNGSRMDHFDFGSDRRLPVNAGDSAAMRDLRGALRMLTNAQEIYYSDPANSYTYADDYRKLKGYELPDGVEVRIVTAAPTGWRAIAMHRASKTVCGMAIGTTPPVGWMSGVAMCP